MTDIKLPQQPRQVSLFARFPLDTDRPWVGLLAAVLLSLFAYLIRLAVDDVLPPGFPYVTFFPAVVLAAFFFGTRSGIVAAVLCFAISWYCFMAPANAVKWDRGTAVALGLYTFVVSVDILLIHWTHVAYTALERERTYSAALAEHREVLFRELQHRVGNNLQMVGSILSLQKRGLSGDAADAIALAGQRVQAIGAIQRDLYHADGSAILLGEMIGKVSQNALIANGRDDVELVLNTAGDTQIAPGDAISMALVLTETIANAIEHGLCGRPGTITVNSVIADGRAQIEVIDSGGTLPPEFDLSRTHSLGLRLARNLAAKLKGDYRLESRPGATAALFAFRTGD